MATVTKSQAQSLAKAMGASSGQVSAVGAAFGGGSGNGVGGAVTRDGSIVSSDKGSQYYQAPTVLSSDRALEKVNQSLSTLGGAQALSAYRDGLYNTEAAKTAKAGLNSQISYIDSLIKQSDELAAQQLKSIRDQYESILKSQEQTNQAYESGVTTAGLVSGRARYAPEIQGAIQSDAVTKGLSKIADKQAEKNQTLIEAQQAQADKNYKLMTQKTDLYNQILKDERDMANQISSDYYKEQDEYRKQASFLGETLAPAILSNLSGDINRDMEYIKNTALQTGGQITPEALFSAVQNYQNAILKERSSNATTDIKNYEYAVSKGYTGSFNDFANTSSTTNSLGQQYGIQLPPDDQIFFVTAGMPPTQQSNTIDTYMRMIAGGKKEEADKYVDRVVLSTLGSGDKTDYRMYSNIERNSEKILNEVDKYIQANPGPYKSLIESGKKWFDIDKDPIWLELSSKLGLTQTQLRNAFFGASLTSGEEAAANQFLSSFKVGSADTFQDAMTKLKSMHQFAKDQRLTFFEIGRGDLGDTGRQTTNESLIFDGFEFPNKEALDNYKRDTGQN